MQTPKNTTHVIRVAALTLAERVLLRWLTMEERKRALLDAARAKAKEQTDER